MATVDGIGRLGFIGLGVMGGPMARNLRRGTGGPLVVHDRDAAALARAAAEGATAVDSVGALAAETDTILLSLPSIVQVEQVVDEILATTRLPRMIVDMSTCDVTRTQALAARCATAGVRFVDAPVARMRTAAIDGTLLILVGGEEEDFALVAPVLRHMGSDVVHCGPSGSGQAVKILNNMVVFLNVRALAEAITIGRAAGLDGRRLFEAFTLGSADSFALRTPGLGALAKDEFPEKAFPTTYALKDIRLAIDLAERHGVRADAATETAQLFERLIEHGFADNYYPMIVTLLDGRLER